MPLILSHRGVNNYVDFFSSNIGTSIISDLLDIVYHYPVRFIKFVFNLQFFVTIHSYLYFGPEGIRRNGTRSWDSLISCSQPSTATTSTSDNIIRIEIDESTPLLGHFCGNHEATSKTITEPCEYTNDRKLQTCELRLMAFVFILITGIIIATYLLIVETRVPSLGFALDLVNHDIWSTVSLRQGKSLNHSKVLHILIMQTGGADCTDTEICIKTLKAMQKKLRIENVTTEIPYNFLIGGDGQTYEVRGWDYESGLSCAPQESLLVIGLLGNFTSVRPNDVYLHSALSLINESLRRKRLQKSYKIYGLRNVTLSRDDGAALFNEIAKWPRFEAVLQVL